MSTKKLMTHVVVGYPTLSATDEIVDALVTGGSDLIELQIPFSDPIADGPAIMHASEVALTQGVKLQDVFTRAHTYHARYPQVTFVFVLYANTLLRSGTESFCEKSAHSGVSGLIVPDLPFDSPEGKWLASAAHTHHISVIPVVAPSTPESRLKAICMSPHAFVYASSLMGVTGTKGKFAGLDAYVARIRRHTSQPIAVGFGIQTREDVREVHQYADIAVIGSAIVRVIDSAPLNGLKSAILSYMHNLR
jgi:tryptophan synthase alpha subunit